MMNKKFLIITFLLFFCCCGSDEDDMKKDIAAFDKFIGVSESEIRQVFGTPSDYEYALYDSDLHNITYKKYYLCIQSNQIGCDCYYKSITIRTSTQEIHVFNYYKTITFIIKGKTCVDWRLIGEQYD